MCIKKRSSLPTLNDNHQNTQSTYVCNTFNAYFCNNRCDIIANKNDFDACLLRIQDKFDKSRVLIQFPHSIYK